MGDLGIIHTRKNKREVQRNKSTGIPKEPLRFGWAIAPIQAISTARHKRGMP